MTDFEHPRDRRHRMAKELDLFRGLRDRAAGKPEAEKKTHQQHFDELRADAQRKRTK